MCKDPASRDRINSFALITYIPEPIAGFLDRLRQELVPNCFLKAHVTILPPRSLSLAPEDAWRIISNRAPRFSAFEIQLDGVHVFPVSDVIYLQVAAGSEQLKQMHDALGVDGLRRQEEFPYHPHVTLAQDLKSDEVDELVMVARKRWADFEFPKNFRAERVVFVQNTRRNQWVDLDECALGGEEKLAGQLSDLLVG
jgi:2'-5' RNA ligase